MLFEWSTALPLTPETPLRGTLLFSPTASASVTHFALKATREASILLNARPHLVRLALERVPCPPCPRATTAPMSQPPREDKPKSELGTFQVWRTLLGLACALAARTHFAVRAHVP